MEVQYTPENCFDSIDVGDLFLYDNEFFVLHRLPIGGCALLSLNGRRSLHWDENISALIDELYIKMKEGGIIHFPKEEYCLELKKR